VLFSFIFVKEIITKNSDMKFGQVEDPSKIDFTLPKDHPKTKKILSHNKKGLENISIGCAKWNKTDLKGFYPKGTKDELTYYSTLLS
jgi:hypothetical protein